MIEEKVKMMLKSEEDDGYCSRSSLDSPVQIIKVDTNSCPVDGLDFKEEESSCSTGNDINMKTSTNQTSPSFLEVMLTRDDWEKIKDPSSIGTSQTVCVGLTSTEISRDKSFVSGTNECLENVSKQESVQKITDGEFQPRKMIKLMPSSSQNLLLFTKQSALSGIVVSSKPNITSNSVAFHSLIRNNQSSTFTSLNNSQQTNRNLNGVLQRVPHINQQVKLTAAEILKSKINHSSLSETPRKIQVPNIALCHKKVAMGKDLNTQGTNNTCTSARTNQPYIKGSKGNNWGSGTRSCPYVGRHELHPVIDHDYCEFSAFNAEIQSGIILMSSETCARTDRLNLKRNKASLQSNPPASSVSTKSSVVKTNHANVNNNHQTRTTNQLASDNRRKYLKRKVISCSNTIAANQIVKNSVGRPRMSGKSDKGQVSSKKSSGNYDSSDDLVSPPLTDDKNYVKIPGSFQNDFVYFATTRGRSSRKRRSENWMSSQMSCSTAAPLLQQQKNVNTNQSVSASIKAFDWYKEMAKTDKNSRFGTCEGSQQSTDKQFDIKLDIGSYLVSPDDEGKGLISESEVADLVMQMLPTSDISRLSSFHNQVLGLNSLDGNCKSHSGNIVASDNGQNLMDQLIDINNIDLNTMASELGSMLTPLSESKQNSVRDQQSFHSMDFPIMTSTSQLLEDINDSDLLITSEIANMNALLNEFSDDHVGICDSGMLPQMTTEENSLPSDINDAMVMRLLTSSCHKLLEGDAGMNEQSTLTHDSAANDAPSTSDNLLFPCYLKEFNLNIDDCEMLKTDDRSNLLQQTTDFSTLLTPPPSLPPSSAPPELTTVNMFWNDLPGLLIEGQEYVRLVDIHKQIMPAKDTGILKKRCVNLNLKVLCCSELQRDFLIRYMNAAKSKSKVIVSKETALALISFYVNPRMRSTVVETECKVEEKPRKNEVKTESGRRAAHSVLNTSRCCRGDTADGLSSPVAPHSRPRTLANIIETDNKSPDSIKRSARLLHKRFSYLDMVNNGLPLSARSSYIKNVSNKQNQHNDDDKPSKQGNHIILENQLKHREHLPGTLKTKLQLNYTHKVSTHPHKNDTSLYRRQAQMIRMRHNMKKLKVLSTTSKIPKHLETSYNTESESNDEEDDGDGDKSENKIHAIEHCYAAYPFNFYASHLTNNSPTSQDVVLNKNIHGPSYDDGGDLPSEILERPQSDDIHSNNLISDSKEVVDVSSGRLVSLGSNNSQLDVNDSDSRGSEIRPPSCKSTSSGERSVLEASSTNSQISSCPQKSKSDRVLRSCSSSSDIRYAVLVAKNTQSTSSEQKSDIFPNKSRTCKLKRTSRPDDEASNENRSPRVIRNKKKFLKPLYIQNNKRHFINKSTVKDTILSKRNEGRVNNYGMVKQQMAQLSRPHRQARKKYQVLKF